MSNQLPLPSERNLPVKALTGAPLPARVSAAEGGVSAEQGFKRSIAAIFRYKWMILLMVAAGTGVGFVLARRQTVIYRTEARIWLEPGLAGGQAGTPIRQGALLTLGSWEQLLRSSAVMDSVVRQERLYLRLQHAADSLAFIDFNVGEELGPGRYSLQVEAGGTYVLSDASKTVVERGVVGSAVGTSVGFDWVPAASVLPVDRALEFTVERPGMVVERLLSNIQAGSPGQNDNFLNVHMRGEDREEITRILTAVIDRFEQVALELKRARLTQTAEILQTQLRAAESALTQADNELEAFKVRTITLPTAGGVPVNPGLQSTDPTALNNYWKLTSQKDQYEVDRTAIQRALGRRDSAISLVVALQLVPSVGRSSELTTALNEAAAADASMRALKTQLTDLHPTVQAQKARLDSLHRFVIPAYSRQLVQTLAIKESETDALIRNAAGELQQIPARSIQEAKLERRRTIADEIYRSLETENHRARLAEVTATPDIQILDKPTIPFSPIDDQRLRMLLMCMGGSLGLALLGAIVRDRFDSRLRYPDQITDRMGLFILGAVPALRRGRLGATDMALAVEAFRGIQLSILHAHGAEAPLALTLTSPGPSDGKSFVASNLAIAFADMGHRTVVVDGDVRRGSVHQLMGNSHKPGLTDYLSGHATREQILQSTRYALLDMIGCGSRGEAGPKLLGSTSMNRLIDDLRREYDVILVDSPPLGACVDPMILGTLTRNLILVLRTGTTDRAMAESKLQILDRLPVRVLGAVLNDVPATGPYRYYSYLAGYEVLDDARIGQEIGSLPASDGNGDETTGGRGARVPEPS